jgi:hypothetical protein
MARRRRDYDQVLALGTKDLPSDVTVVAAQPLRAVWTGKFEIAHSKQSFHLSSIAFAAKGCTLFPGRLRNPNRNLNLNPDPLI